MRAPHASLKGHAKARASRVPTDARGVARLGARTKKLTPCGRCTFRARDWGSRRNTHSQRTCGCLQSQASQARMWKRAFRVHYSRANAILCGSFRLFILNRTDVLFSVSNDSFAMLRYAHWVLCLLRRSSFLFYDHIKAELGLVMSFQ